MAAVFPQLSPSGSWITDKELAFANAVSSFFYSEEKQSTEYYGSILAYRDISVRYTHEPESLVNAMDTALRTLAGRYGIETPDVRCSIHETPEQLKSAHYTLLISVSYTLPERNHKRIDLRQTFRLNKELKVVRTTTSGGN